jgi:hypothetical protein
MKNLAVDAKCLELALNDPGLPDDLELGPGHPGEEKLKYKSQKLHTF